MIISIFLLFLVLYSSIYLLKSLGIIMLLMRDKSKKAKMSDKATDFVDGEGTCRISKQIFYTLNIIEVNKKWITGYY